MVSYMDANPSDEILKKLQAHSEQLERIYRSAEKTRKYFLWSLIIGILTVVLPLIGLAFILPFFLKNLMPPGLF